MDEVELDWDQPVESEPIKCPNCGSLDNHIGYGFAAGALGGYIMCLDCGKVLMHDPDPEAGPPANPNP